MSLEYQYLMHDVRYEGTKFETGGLVSVIVAFSNHSKVGYGQFSGARPALTLPQLRCTGISLIIDVRQSVMAGTR